MTCQEIAKLLTEDFYGALALRDVRGHLEACSSCRRLSDELEEIENLKDSLAARTTAPPDLPRRIARGFSRVRFRHFLLHLAAPILALFVVAVAGYVRLSSAPVSVTSKTETVADQVGLQEAWALDSVWEVAPPPERESRQPQYFEVVLPDPEGPVVVELPAKIRVHRSDPGRDYLAYVSH